MEQCFLSWQSNGFGTLDYATTMKIVIPGATLISLSFEMLIFTFFPIMDKSRNKLLNQIL